VQVEAIKILPSGLMIDVMQEINKALAIPPDASLHLQIGQRQR